MKRWCALLLVISVLLPALASADGVLTPAANPPDKVLYDYRSYIRVQDELMSGAAAASGVVGTLGWFFSGGTVAAQASEDNRIGLIRKTTSAVINTVSSMLLSGSQGQLTQNTYYTILWITRTNQTDANTTVRIGASSGCTIAPTNGLYFERLDADTNWFAVSNIATVKTRSDTGVAISTALWPTMQIVHTPSSASFYLNGVFVATHSTPNIPTVGISPCLQITTSAAADKTMDVDYFELNITGLTR